MRQQLALEKLIIDKGEKVSNTVSLHGDTAVLTIYAPLLEVPAVVEVCPDKGKKFVPLFYKGQPVTLQSLGATNVPVPACAFLRISTPGVTKMPKEFQALELLEI